MESAYVLLENLKKVRGNSELCQITLHVTRTNFRMHLKRTFASVPGNGENSYTNGINKVKRRMCGLF